MNLQIKSDIMPPFRRLGFLHARVQRQGVSRLEAKTDKYYVSCK